MSDANLSTIAYGPETTLGTAPAALQELRFTKESLKFEKETVSSAEIRADRQVSDNQKVSGQPSGGFEFELSFGFILPWLEAAMQADWQVINLVAATCDLDLTEQTVTHGTAGGFATVPVGAMIVIADAGTPENNGPKRVISKDVTGTILTLAVGSLTADEVDAVLTITAKTIRPGTERKSFTLEKKILNGEGVPFFQSFNGMTVDTLALKIESKKLITGTVGLIGTTYAPASESVINPTPYIPAATGPIMNGTNNIGTIRMDGAAATDRFKGISIEIANNVRGKDACGFEGNWDIGLGQFKVTGNLNAYFRNNLLPEKIKNHTPFSLDFFVEDAAGNRLYFYAPQAKPATGDPNIQGINTDVMIDTAYEAIRGDANNLTGTTLIVDAVAAA